MQMLITKDVKEYINFFSPQSYFLLCVGLLEKSQIKSIEVFDYS